MCVFDVIEVTFNLFLLKVAAVLHGGDETMAVIGERYAFYCKNSLVIFDNSFCVK